MTKHPTHCAVPLDDIHNKYSAMHFIPAFSRFIAQYQNSEYSKAQVKTASHFIHIPFNILSVFYCIKFVSYDLYALNPLNKVVVDSIHVNPVHLNKYWKVVPGRFDTAIINVAPGNDSGVQGASRQVSMIFKSQLSILIGPGVGQIWCIFTLLSTAVGLWFLGGFPYQHLAYVEWFTPLSQAPVD
jgi:hypothetical protein